MKILIVYSQTQFGFNPVLPRLIDALGDPGFEPVQSLVVINSDVVHGLPHDAVDVAFDAVICIDSLQWFFQNRTTLSGRPWVAVMAFAVIDALELMQSIPRSLELGINAIFTSCAAFVDQTSALVPAVFTKQPSAVWGLDLSHEIDPLDREVKFGTVLPNVEDRDFSQLIFTLEHLKEAGREGKFTLFVDDREQMRVPEVLAPYVTRVADDLFSCFQKIVFFIPAPRITNYRLAVPPPEIFEALERGCFPLLMRHPLMNALHLLVSPQFANLSEYTAALQQACTVGLPMDLNSAKPYISTPYDVRTQVWFAYARWRANNATPA